MMILRIGGHPRFGCRAKRAASPGAWLTPLSALFASGERTEVGEPIKHAVGGQLAKPWTAPVTAPIFQRPSGNPELSRGLCRRKQAVFSQKALVVEVDYGGNSTRADTTRPFDLTLTCACRPRSETRTVVAQPSQQPLPSDNPSRSRSASPRTDGPVPPWRPWV